MRGERDVYLKGDLDKPAQTDQEGNAATLRPTDGELAFRIGRSPTFIEGVKSCASATLGTPLYPALPDARTHALAPLASLDRWQIIDLAEDILDNGNFDYPRQRGAFEVTVAEDAERGACLQFTLKSSGKRPPYVPSYQRIDLKTPIEMPEQPTAIGLYVYGNGGWGRILIELCDAKGERWFSQGMPMAWNANDTESLSYIIHDDWRWMQIPVPGHYGSGYHWPRYCNWRNGTADETGDGIVDYPLTLTGLIVEQREKVVYVNAMVDASKQPVRLSDLKAVYGDPEQVGDWEQHATALP